MTGLLSKLLIQPLARAGINVEAATRGTPLGSVAVAQVEPPGFELARSGLRFAGGCQVIANGIDPVSAIPTTTATLALHNGEPDGGRSLWVDMLSFCLGSGTAAAGAALFVCVSNGKISQPSQATNYNVQSLSAGGVNSRARWATAVTFPSNSVWFSPAASMQLAAGNVGQGAEQPSRPGILVPPGYALGIGILSGAGTSPKYIVSASWFELETLLA